MGGAGDGNERIDLIDVDPAIFVDPAPPPANRSRQALKGIGLVAILAVAAIFWWPSSNRPEWQVLQAAPVPAAGLSDELVFDAPVGNLAVVELASAPEDVKPDLGYVFAEPGGTMLTSRWASFRSHRTNSSTAQIATDGPMFGGAHARVRNASLRHFIEWGPVDRRTWTVSTNRFGDEETIDFAHQVAVVEGLPALAKSYDLGAMRPVGSIAALDCVVALTSLLGGRIPDRGPVMPTVLTWATASSGPPNPTLTGATTLGSIAAPSDVLPLVEFVLGAGTATTVHGQAAVIITSKDLGPVVAWLEDGRLIIVAGDLAPEELIALAESVRSAHSDGEWRAIQRTAVQGIAYGFSTEPLTAVKVYKAVDPDTGTTFAVTVNFQAAPGQPLSTLFACADERSAHGDSTSSNCTIVPAELPLLTFLEGNGRRYVLAVVESMGAGGATLRMHLASGAVRTFPLQDFGSELGGAVAAMVPSDASSIELLVGGVTVASSTSFDTTH